MSVFVGHENENVDPRAGGVVNFIARRLERQAERMRPARQENVASRFPSRRAWTVPQLHAQVRALERELFDRGVRGGARSDSRRERLVDELGDFASAVGAIERADEAVGPMRAPIAVVRRWEELRQSALEFFARDGAA